MTVNEALEYIHSVSWMGSRPGLERTVKLLSLMGDPHKNLRFVHVAGTNGKGSVSAMTAAVLRQGGYKVGLYTSPYILRFNERMQVNGVEITDAELAEITEYVKPYAESMEDHPTEFELVTAISFEYFKRQGCDVVVLEVGLGGELDSTNVIRAPEVAVITEIDFDHMGVLGNSLESIAAAKAGIIKKGTTVVSANNTAASSAVIISACKKVGCDCIVPQYDAIENKKLLNNGISFEYKGEEYFVPLFGSYQYRNALMAITVCKVLAQKGFAVTEAHVKAGLASVSWRGRFEKLMDNPVFIYDGGHNPQGVAAAVQCFAERYGEGVVLLGVMADKDYHAEIKMLLPIAKKFITVTPGNPRALPSDKLAEKIISLGGDAQAAKTVEEGVAMAVSLGDKNTPILALGSLYMYGEIYASLKKLFLQKG